MLPFVQVMFSGRGQSVAPTSYVDQSVRSLSKTKEYLSDGMDIATLISMQYAKIGQGLASNCEFNACPHEILGESLHGCVNFVYIL